MPPRFRLVAAVCVAAAVAAPPASADPDRATCGAAYAKSQELRGAHLLLRTREQLLVCAQASCSEIIRADCVRWLTEVEHDIPTVGVHARDASGADVIDARLFVDGKLSSERLDGRAIAVDPGEHVLRIERAGEPPLDRRILAAEGEKSRVVVMTFPGPREAAPTTPVSRPEQPPGRQTPVATRPIPAGVFVLAGLTVVAGGVWGYFGIKGETDLTHLRDTCSPKCNPADVDHARAELRVGDVALLTGLVSLGVAATWFFIVRSHHDARPTVTGSGPTLEFAF